MKLLFITNFFPPVSRGGYEEWCREVAETLRGRDHEVVVLTSRHARTSTQNEPDWIRRELHLEMPLASFRNGIEFFTKRKTRETENLDVLRQLFTEFEPDAILIWGMWNLNRSLAATAEHLRPQQVVYYLGDYWPTLPSQYEFYWRVPAKNWLTAIPKGLLRPIANQVLARETRPDLALKHAIFPTTFMQNEYCQKGIHFSHSGIVYGAIDTEAYPFKDNHRNGSGQQALSLLYVGRLIRDKGVHTAIEAVAHLRQHYGLGGLTLRIVGNGDPNYEAFLHQLVVINKLNDQVRFLGSRPKEDMPELYGQADILLFTSTWPEPFGRVIVEAMASGVIVVGTATGGAKEIMVDNDNALIFNPEDAEGLASQILRLHQSPDLRQKLAQEARKTAIEKFAIQRMSSEIESYLKNLNQ